MNKHIKIALIILLFVWLMLVLIAVWPGIPPDATPGDLWQMMGIF